MEFKKLFRWDVSGRLSSPSEKLPVSRVLFTGTFLVLGLLAHRRRSVGRVAPDD